MKGQICYEEIEETKTEMSKTVISHFPSVAKWYGSGLLTRIPQVRILSGGFWGHNSVGRVPVLQAGCRGFKSHWLHG